MAVFPNLDRLKSQLRVTDLPEKSPALFQVINQLIDAVRQLSLASQEAISAGGGGTGGGGITQLTGDVLAGPGNGSVPATIAPHVVTYDKMQETADESILLGRGSDFGAGDIEEIELGPNLKMNGTVLNITTGGGGIGLDHDLLSDIHPDTIPFSPPIFGDIIVAGEPPIPSETSGATGGIGPSKLTEDFYGIRPAYLSNLNAPSGGFSPQYFPPFLEEIEPIYQTHTPFLGLNNIFVQSNLVDDFYGVRPSYIRAPEFAMGEQPQYLAFPVNQAIPPPVVIEEDNEIGAWRRIPRGTEGQIFSIKDSFPQYTNDINIPGNIHADGNLDIDGTGNIDGPLEVSGNIESTNGSIIAGVDLEAGGKLDIDGVIFERGRIIALDEWVDIPFNAGDYTANGGVNPSWAVELLDVIRAQYKISGDSITYAYTLFRTTVASDSGDVTELRINVPIAIVGIFAKGIIMQEKTPAVATFNSYVGYDSSVDSNRISIQKFPIPTGGPFDQTVNGTYLGFEITARLA